MTYLKRWHLHLFLLRTIVCALFFGATSMCAFSQNPPDLQITSPADGTIVNPGQAISVTVESPTGLLTRISLNDREFWVKNSDLCDHQFDIALDSRFLINSLLSGNFSPLTLITGRDANLSK